MIPSGYLNSQLQLQPQFLRPQKPRTTPHSRGKSSTKWMNSAPSEQWKRNSKEEKKKRRGGDTTQKFSFFTPLKHNSNWVDRGEATATAQWCTQTSLFELTHWQPLPRATLHLMFRVSPIVFSILQEPDRQNPHFPLPKHFFLPVRTLWH